MENQTSQSNDKINTVQMLSGTNQEFIVRKTEIVVYTNAGDTSVSLKFDPVSLKLVSVYVNQ